MRESVTYQAILEEGREEGVRRTVLHQASLRFGPPDDATLRRLEAIDGKARLQELTGRVLTAASWDDLLSPMT